MGRVTEVLGDPDDFGVDVEMMIRKHQLPRVFPEQVLAEARSVAHLDLNEVAQPHGIFAFCSRLSRSMEKRHAILTMRCW